LGENCGSPSSISALTADLSGISQKNVALILGDSVNPYLNDQHFRSSNFFQHEYATVQKQAQQAQEILDFLQGNQPTSAPFLPSKMTTAAFYQWMQGELFGLYYQYYRFSFDIARKAEQTMKRELMRPELDVRQFIQFNYWDSGYKGLLSGEKLVFDIKQMEMAYHDSNKRELELTRHVSLRQLDPLALLALKITGSCTVTIPEWLYDLDCPGLYMRRIKNIAASVPCVVGPYTSINFTLSLQRSTVRAAVRWALLTKRSTSICAVR
jgi:hypothetical protein